MALTEMLTVLGGTNNRGCLWDDFQVLCLERIPCSNIAQTSSEINNAITMVALNSFSVRHIKENINIAPFPCSLFKGVSTCGGIAEK